MMETLHAFVWAQGRSGCVIIIEKIKENTLCFQKLRLFFPILRIFIRPIPLVFSI